MVFQTKAGNRLLINTQKYISVGKNLSFLMYTGDSHRSIKRIFHYARGQVPLCRYLQIFYLRFCRTSRRILCE